jgi:hypothetical protein
MVKSPIQIAHFSHHVTDIWCPIWGCVGKIAQGQFSFFFSVPIRKIRIKFNIKVWENNTV